MDHFKLVSEYKPSGDQPEAIEKLVNGVNWGLHEQTLLGVTGSGKTFTMASVIEKVNRPTLVLAHNKTLAAQLCSEFREFFPENAVEYFISYYDYYQPEAYIAHTDTYIEKDSSVNEEIDRLRHSATSALFERRDVIVVSSVSCLYGLGDPIDYKSMVISLRVGQEYPLDEVLKKLTEIRYERNDLDFSRNKFRLRGDTLEIYPAYWSGRAIRVEFFGDEIDPGSAKSTRFPALPSGLWSMWPSIPPVTMWPPRKSFTERCWKFSGSATTRWPSSEPTTSSLRLSELLSVLPTTWKC